MEHFVMGYDSEHCFCCGSERKFNLMSSLFPEENRQGDSDENNNNVTESVFTDDKIAERIFANLASEDLFAIRGVNKDWNVRATHWLRLKDTHQTQINSEEGARAFLRLLQNSPAAAHPFSYLSVDLWEISLDTILELARVTENWMNGLTMSGVSPGEPSLEPFIENDVSTKVAVMLYAGSKLTFLSVRTDFQVYISGILELILPRTFPRLESLFINILYTDKSHTGNLLEHVIRRRPGLSSLGLLLPENGGDKLLVELPGILQGSKLQRISLTTPISSRGIHILKNARVVKFTSLRIRVSGFGGLEFRKNFRAWLAYQSETLTTLGLTMDASGPAPECLALPALVELQMLSLLVVGSTVTPLLPFSTAQFPKLSSFAFVQSSAELDLFSGGFFPEVTSVGFSGKNGALPGSLAKNLPNLQHVTLCGVSPEHLTTLLTQFTFLLELVLIFEGGEVDYWDQFTGGAPRSWEELYEQVFPDDEDEDPNVDEEWEAMTQELDVEGYNEAEFDALFDDFVVGLNETASSFQKPETPWKPSLGNMKRLEYLKIDGWNEGAFLGLVHMSCDRRFGPLKHLHIQIPPTWEPPAESLRLLELYHWEVRTTTVADAMRSQ